MRAKARDLARAKINLTLHITGERSDGYHLIDSLVGFAAVGDVVTARPADACSLEVTGPMAADVPTDDANLVLRAARFLGGAPVALTLDKRLPVASGIGGGSSDAAAALRAIRTLDGRPMPEGVERLGADVPVCLRDRPARMRGVGEHLSDVPAFPPTHLCLVNPGVAVSTPAVFAALSEKSNRPMPEPPAWPDADRFATWIAGQRNDLEIPARSLAPAIGVVLDELGATDGCLLARMSGSGATCFGLYATALEAEDAALAIAAARPGWWVRASPLG